MKFIVYLLTITVFLILLVSIGIKALGLERYTYPGRGMEPTIESGKSFFIRKINPRAELLRGDLVIYTASAEIPSFAENDDIKVGRIVGLPGETVSIENRQVKINDQIIEEKYLSENTKTDASTTNLWNLGANDYFILGDNRKYSVDSRVAGPISREKITGKLLL